MTTILEEKNGVLALNDKEFQELRRLRNKHRRILELQANNEKKQMGGGMKEEAKKDKDSIVTDTVR